MEESANISALYLYARGGCKLRPGSSTDSAIDQCARRVGVRIMGSSVLLHQATRGGDWECIVGSTQLGYQFHEFEFREHKVHLQ